MNFTTLMNLMSSPQTVLTEQMAAQLIRENPQQWQQAQQMFNGKTHEQQVKALRQLYQSRGMNLDAIARQYGVQI